MDIGIRRLLRTERDSIGIHPSLLLNISADKIKKEIDLAPTVTI
jgi:hypothetical protein